MGKGIIKENLGAGLYKVELVYARERVDKELKFLADRQADLESKRYDGPWTPERDRKDKELTLAIEAIKKRIAWINEKAPANKVIEAYCVDYTEDLAVGAEVGTVELARSETQILQPENISSYTSTRAVLIKPGYKDDSKYSALADGILNPPINQSPAQIFYNWAMSPGTMKWKPRYRSAVIDSISEDYADITLTDLVYLTNDRTEIDIDQSLERKHVPIEYMDCNGDAFEEGDEVVVEFTGMNWDSPKIVGFTGQPVECLGVVYYSVVFNKITENVGSGFNPTTSNELYERLVFKIEPGQAPVWSTFAEAGATCNVDDAFTSTKVREYACISSIENFYVAGEFVPYDCSIAIGNGDACSWGGKVDEEGQPEDPPQGFGEIEKVFVKNVENLGPRDLTTQYGGLFTIDGHRISVWLSKMACGIITPKSSKAIPNNSTRKLYPVIWPKGYSGRYQVDLILPIFEAVKTVVTFERGMAWFGCCDDPSYSGGYLSQVAPNWQGIVSAAGLQPTAYPVIYQDEPYWSPAHGCYECLWSYQMCDWVSPNNPCAEIKLNEYWVNGYNIYSGRTGWFGFDILEWKLGEPDPVDQIPQYPRDLRTPYSDLDPFFDLCIDDGVSLQNIEWFKNVETVPYTHFGYGPTVNWQYAQPMEEVWQDRFGNQITKTKETHIYTLETTWGSAPLTVGGSLWLVEGVTKVEPRLTWYWGLFTIPAGWEVNDEDPPEKPFEEFDVAGENYSGESDDIIAGATDWYYGYQEQTDERIVQIFYRKASTYYRVVVNFICRDVNGDLADRHFVALMALDGSLNSCNDFSGWSTFNEDNGDKYLYSMGGINGSSWSWAGRPWFPAHVSNSDILSFLNEKKEEIGAFAYTRPMALVEKS